LLAAQCYGLKFTTTMPTIEDPNVFVIGLSWGDTNVQYTTEKLWARHMELDEHIKFITKIEDAFVKINVGV
jgi:hypothetical protein